MKGRGPPRLQASLPSESASAPAPPRPWGAGPLFRPQSLGVPGPCSPPALLTAKYTAGDSVRGNNLPIGLPRLAGTPLIRCVWGGVPAALSVVAPLDSGPGL